MSLKALLAVTICRWFGHDWVITHVIADKQNELRTRVHCHRCGIKRTTL